MKAFVYRNNNALSIETCARIEESLKARNITVLNSYDESVDFLVCIGGDGTFLSFIHKLGFPTVPILSINTGHLGFFQEASPSDAEKLIDAYLNGDYKTQCIHKLEYVDLPHMCRNTELKLKAHLFQTFQVMEYLYLLRWVPLHITTL